jgi:ferredoxin-NADP reductase
LTGKYRRGEQGPEGPRHLNNWGEPPIHDENRLYAAPRGWSGWRDFVIESTKAESEVIRSFLLVPKDGGRVIIHGAENGRVHAMGAHVRELAAQAHNVTARTFYNVPDTGDQAGRDFDERGLISTNWVASHTPIEEAVYYLCGPRPFLRNMVGGLARTGVALNRILYEFFAPADELLAA